ncbi:MAG: hypothetical protein ACOYJG_10055 [Prevotella sp.]|jgi:hypothetical protein
MKNVILNRHFNFSSMRRVESILSGKEKPSKQTLNRLALLAGFQSWEDLMDALKGDADASINYEEKEK